MRWVQFDELVDVISVDLLAGDAGSFIAKVDGLAKAGHLSPSPHNAFNTALMRAKPLPTVGSSNTGSSADDAGRA